MEVVVRSKDLLSIVFSFIDWITLAKSSFVCRLWKVIANSVARIILESNNRNPTNCASVLDEANETTEKSSIFYKDFVLQSFLGPLVGTGIR